MGNQSIFLDLTWLSFQNTLVALVWEVQIIAPELKEGRNILKPNLVKFSTGLKHSCGRRVKWRERRPGRTLDSRASNNQKLPALGDGWGRSHRAWHPHQLSSQLPVTSHSLQKLRSVPGIKVFSVFPPNTLLNGFKVVQCFTNILGNCGKTCTPQGEIMQPGEQGCRGQPVLTQAGMLSEIPPTPGRWPGIGFWHPPLLQFPSFRREGLGGRAGLEWRDSWECKVMTQCQRC